MERDIIERTHHALALVHACARAGYSSSQALSPGYRRRVHGTVQQRLQSLQTGMLILSGYVICKILYGGFRACTVSLAAGTRVRPRDKTFGISVQDVIGGTLPSLHSVLDQSLVAMWHQKHYIKSEIHTE